VICETGGAGKKDGITNRRTEKGGQTGERPVNDWTGTRKALRKGGGQGQGKWRAKIKPGTKP